MSVFGKYLSLYRPHDRKAALLALIEGPINHHFRLILDHFEIILQEQITEEPFHHDEMEQQKGLIHTIDLLMASERIVQMATERFVQSDILIHSFTK